MSRQARCRFEDLVWKLNVQVCALLALLASVAPAAPPGEAGLALHFDGVDDFAVAFPSFALAGDWTVEAWVDQVVPSEYESERCIFHQSSYAAQNVLTLSVDHRLWRLRYGEHELSVPWTPASAEEIEAAASSCVGGASRPPGQHHVAVTHSLVNATAATVALYIDGVEAVVEEGLLPPTGLDPTMPFMLGACSGLARNGVVRSKAFAGSLDEVRHWSIALSPEQLLSGHNLTGPPSDWPADSAAAIAAAPSADGGDDGGGGDGGGLGALRAQYSFDVPGPDGDDDPELLDTSGNGNHGLRGGGGSVTEMPRFEHSVFTDLRLGPLYFEFLTNPAGGSENESLEECLSVNCLSLSALVPCDGVGYGGYILRSVPSGVNVTTLERRDTPLVAGSSSSDAVLFVSASEPVAFSGPFVLELCAAPADVGADGALDSCADATVRSIIFRVLPNSRPTAGEARSLQLLGEAGYLELGQPLPESGTIEFWTQAATLAGRQVLFSVSRRDLGKPEVDLDLPALTLVLSDGEAMLEVCMAPMVGGEQAYVRRISALATTEPQHISLSWRYVRAARGHAVYEFAVYQNCELVSGPLTVSDACVHFGYADDKLHFPTLGQRYSTSPRGLVPSDFAAAHFADFRLWARPLPGAELCDGLRALPNASAVSEGELAAHFPMTAGDAEREDRLLANFVPAGAPAALRCAPSRYACPDFAASRGFALRHSVFELPAQPVILTTSSGDVSSGDGGVSATLPALQVALPVFDRDNFGQYDISGLRSLDAPRARLLQLPDPACGTLLLSDQSTPAVAGRNLEGSALPLVFEPASAGDAADGPLACETNATYVAVDMQGSESAYAAEVRFVVKVPGPRITQVELIEPGISDGGPDIGDIIAITFDRPTSFSARSPLSTGRRLLHSDDGTNSVDLAAGLRGALAAVDGTLGSAVLAPSWSDSGDVLLLRIEEQVDLQYEVVNRGTCFDHGLQVIDALSGCVDAALWLGLARLSIDVVAISEADSPEGCFKLDGHGLRFNSAAASAGKGSETSTPGFPKLPICAAPGLALEPSVSKLRFVDDSWLSLQTTGVDSYPVMDESPPVVGSFTESFCPNGTVFFPGNVSCLPCGEGNFQSPDGLSCLPCAPGTVAPEPNTVVCLACEPGRYMPPGHANRSICLEAPAGMYVERIGAARALDCPRGALAEQLGSTTCRVCPHGAHCEEYMHAADFAKLPAGTRLPAPRAFAMPLPGNFRTDRGGIVDCELPLACEGWDFVAERNECKEGMGGFMCQGCLGGYWRPSDKTRSLCSQCGWVSPVPILLVLLLFSVCIWIIGVLSVDAACWGNMHAVVLRLALNYFAAASVLSRLEAWELTAKVGVDNVDLLVTSLNALFRFDGGVAAHLMGLECLVGDLLRTSAGSAEQWPVIKAMTLFWILMPLIWPIFLVLLGVTLFEMYTWSKRFGWMIRNEPIKEVKAATLRVAQSDVFAREPRFLGLIRTRAARARLRERLPIAVQDCLPLIIVGQFIFLPTMLRQLALILTCDSLGESESDRWRLFVSPEVVCWHGEHMQWAAGTMAAVVLWGAVLPGFMMLWLWRRRSSLFNNMHLRALVGFISDGYEQRWACWEGVIYGRKLLIILIGAWPGLSRQAEMAFYQVIGVAAVLLHYSCKPFDNRSGELLDRVELYGLCLFLLQVTFVQFVLLSDPAERYDLLAVLVSGTLMALASTFFTVRSGHLRFLAAVVITVFFFALTAMYWFAGGPLNREYTAFLLLALAITLNAAYVFWVLVKVVKQIVEAVAEDLSRKRLALEQELLRSSARDAVALAMKSRNMLIEALPIGALTPKPKMPKLPGRSIWQRIMSAHFDSLGALIWFDTSTQELVLGLHPERFTHDQRISSYLRRKLAAAGPFLTDEERQFIAMGLRDAFVHLILDCDMNTVHCALLEFLIRAAFAWFRLQEDEQKGGKENNSNLGTPAREETPPQQGRLSRGGSRELLPAELSAAQAEAKDFVELLFDEATFESGIRACDFQAQLDKFTKMQKDEVSLLVDTFLAAYAHRNGGGFASQALNASAGSSLGG